MATMAVRLLKSGSKHLQAGAWRARHFSSLADNSSPGATAVTGKAPHLAARDMEPRKYKRQLVLGAVCYSITVGSIWKGMMRHFNRQGLDIDYVMFTNYERQNRALLDGQIDIAWNGPLAHSRLVRAGYPVVSMGMRDSDRDFVTHVIVRQDANISKLSDLNGRRIACGTVDSPQAYILPWHFLHKSNEVDFKTLTVLRYDRDIGKHGDTAYGEDAVLESLRTGAAEAGFISDLMWSRFVADNKTEGLTILPVPVHRFDHCQFDALPRLGGKTIMRFHQALLSQRSDGSAHPEDRKTMELEGIRKEWLPARGGAIPAPIDSSRPPAVHVDDVLRQSLPDATKGYENMLSALELFNEPKVAWPGVLHTPARHPFKHLMVDSALVLDAYGC